MIIRELEFEDYYRGFLDVINLFTKGYDPAGASYVMQYNAFVSLYGRMLGQGCKVLVAVEDEKVVGTAKILLEMKFHNRCALMGHIEDVAVLPEHRHKKIGKRLVQECMRFARDCYKVVLSCKEELCGFYGMNGFVKTGTAMTFYRS